MYRKHCDIDIYKSIVAVYTGTHWWSTRLADFQFFDLIGCHVYLLLQPINWGGAGKMVCIFIQFSVWNWTINSTVSHCKFSISYEYNPYGIPTIVPGIYT